MAAKKSYSVKLSAIPKDLDKAIKELGKIQKKKATLAPDDSTRLDKTIQDLTQARELVATGCTGGKKMTALYSSGSGS